VFSGKPINEETMSVKIYVGNLPHTMTEEELQTIFTEAGEVISVKIITDRHTGQPRGFGFVEMATKADGQKAISTINGRDVEGRTLKVNEARPQQKSSFGGGGGGGGYGRGRR
jgi:RNA recognition motif-containing protein